ncbi:MAG: YvcK family protein [Candidatus Nealsonbacteria bacterium]|nr:YvcK family protein [Candidatus Nealsonbacteria bacterium]
MARTPKIVCIGGGTGTFTVLSGLKKYNADLSAIVTMADDGGSSGILRDELGVLPPGDVRQCLIALSEEDLLLRKLFNYRFGLGPFLGHSFGNIFMAAMEKSTGSFDKAIEKAAKVLNVKGEVIPVTLDKVRLVAKLESGKEIVGEKNITKSHLLSRQKIKKLYLKPKADPNQKAIKAIKEADVIAIGPGNLYSSIIPNLLVEGIPEAIRKSKAVKIYNCNLMTKFGHTDGLNVKDFALVIERYLGERVLNYVTYNTKKPPAAFLKKYAKEGGFVECQDFKNQENKFVGADLISDKIYEQDKADTFLQRTLIRHDPDKLAKLLMKLCPVVKI